MLSVERSDGSFDLDDAIIGSELPLNCYVNEGDLLANYVPITHDELVEFKESEPDARSCILYRSRRGSSDQHVGLSY